MFFHFGECVDGWGRMAQMIREDTRSAIMKYSTRLKQDERDQIFNFFQPDDWVIYQRCLIFRHGFYAPAVLRTYSIIPTNGTFNVYIMPGRIEDDFGLCDEIMKESTKYIKNRNPNVNIKILKSGTKFVDFSRLVFAPNVLVPNIGSSWALWSAIMANNNTVVSVLPQRKTNVSSLPSSIQIIKDIPFMWNPGRVKEGALNYGIPFQKFSNSKEHRKAVMDYFRTA